MSDNSPLTLLHSIRDRAIEFAAQGVNFTGQSAGIKNIAFMVNETRFFCDAQSIKEVAVCDNLMLVPQTKAWMRGLVNSKGMLYSVTDLSLLAGYERATNVNRGHLLIVSDEASQSALLVNRVIGFRYFDAAGKLADLTQAQDTLDGLSSFVDEAFHSDGEDYFHLNVPRLIASEQFREIQ